MKNKIIFLASLVTLAACEAPPTDRVKSPPHPIEPPPAPVTAAELDLENTEKVRLGESLKAYPMGRYVDPNDPNVMHEAHTIYRREAGANWNLNPNAPTVVPLGPVLAVADPARTPNPLPAELEQKIAEQNQLMATLVEQNEALAAELTKLNKQIVDLREKQSGAEGEGKK